MSKHTALHEVHAGLGASFTDFGGWDMPLKYGSELVEHRAVRATAGIFDLSHMGEVRVSGPEAAAYLDFALLARYSIMKVGKAKYGVIVNEHGRILDDLITYRIGADEFLVVPNASNVDVVFAALSARTEGFDVSVVNESADTSLVAVQGPASQAILEKVATPVAFDGGEGSQVAATIDELKYYAWMPVRVGSTEVMLARTGYTGEDGFELYVPNAAAVSLWETLAEAGAGFDLVPCGLASRDSLRLEAGMPLYGHEMNLETTPIDAGLGGMVNGSLKNKGEFFARAALEEIAGTTPARILVGLSSEGRRAAREGSAVLVDGAEVGIVTSGQPSPTLGHPIALAHVDTAVSAPGTAVSVDIRGKAHDFTVVQLPFYSRD